MTQKLTIHYRDWRITASDHEAKGERIDGSGERFECHRQACFTEAVRFAKRKVDDLEGPENWDMDYKDEALR